ncbi:glucan endo-1,3-beta-D-glucosidase-like [Typha angustifolia]|uniref:glucan endo-1,3-beta-D-glucosidase-like n=1 Tax=Typha angustifolia TaxID=59011 RepID=UPI003C2DE2E8
MIERERERGRRVYEEPLELLFFPFCLLQFQTSDYKQPINILFLISFLLSSISALLTSPEMARSPALFLPIFHFLLLVLFHLIPGETTNLTSCQKTWCIAKPSTDDINLDDNIQFACGETNCAPIQTGGSCFFPDTRISHASVAMNLYYQSKGMNPWNCYFNGSGLTVLTDPSYGSCSFA